MTAHTLSRYFRKPRQDGLEIACDARILGGNSKPTGSTVHRRAGILHPRRHIFGNFSGAMQLQRRHSKPRFRQLCGNVRVTHAEMHLNLLQRLEMITHVGESLLSQYRRKLHQLPSVWSAGSGHAMAVLMLSDSECCTAGSQNCDDNGQQNTHTHMAS